MMLIKNTTLEYAVLKLLSMGKKSKDKLLLILDDTLIKKPFAQKMTGAWHGMPLRITAHRRIDKKGQESIVFQAATYAAKPSQHIQNYRGRWSIEKMIRTSKQSLALQNCFSTNLNTQLNHMAAVLFAFSLTQIEMHWRHLKTPEQALRALNRKKFNFLKQYFYRSLASYY